MTMSIPEAVVPVRVKGRYRMEVSKSDGSDSRVVAEFDNMILDSGLDHIFTAANNVGGAYDQVFVVGSGTTPEDPLQTQLEARFASATIAGSSPTTNRTISVVAGSPFCVTASRWVRFAAGAAAGNITEVGVGWGATSLFSRALVRDADGNPTSVSVLPDEYLHLTYSLDIYVDVTDKPFTLNFPHGSHEGVLRPADLDTSRIKDTFGQSQLVRNLRSSASRLDACIVSPSALGDVTSRPGSGSSTQIITVPALSNPAYIPGSFSDTAVLTYSPSLGNISGGIRSLVLAWQHWVSYQISFDPPIPKDSDHVFSLTLRVTLGRA